MELMKIISEIIKFSKPFLNEEATNELKKADEFLDNAVTTDVANKYPEKTKQIDGLLTLLTTDVKGRVYKGNIADHIYEYRQWLALTYKTLLGPKFMDENILKAIKSKIEGKKLWEEGGYKSTSAYRKITEGLSGTPLRMYYEYFNDMDAAIAPDAEQWMFNPSKCVMIGCAVPFEIVRAMGLTPYLSDGVQTQIRTKDQYGTVYYINKTEELGIPLDTCSFPKVPAGVALAGHFMEDMACCVFSNLSCDSSLASYALIEETYGKPVFRIDHPYRFKTELGRESFTKQMHEMIDFIHEHTGHTLDEDKLRHLCENYNKMQDLELERWEMNRHEKPPIPGHLLFSTHLLCFNGIPGQDSTLKLLEKQTEMAREMIKKGECAVKNLKYRAVLWNPPPGAYANFHRWLERCWGVAILNDMETFGCYEYIDTSSLDSMLYGLANRTLYAPMSRHTRGDLPNFFDDLWKSVELYNADFIILADHIGCHPVSTLHGMLKDECKKRNIKLMIFRQDLADIRVESKQGIRNQVNNFMSNIMNAEPLDSSLLTFDDSNEW